MTDRVLIIAEAGVNHNGSLDRALALIDAAADAGADLVKFQTFQASQLVTTTAPRALYQIQNTGEGSSQLEMLRALELNEEDHRTLVRRCSDRGIGFLSTAFDAQSLAFLASLDMPFVKIPSGDLTCAPLLLSAARLGRPILLSTGMANLADIEAALEVLAFALTCDGQPKDRRETARAYAAAEGRGALRGQVTLLHCVSNYPASSASVNLRAMATMSEAFGLRVGYSDHTLGIAVPIAAAALGATVIEKHFTLDRTLPGPDHKASLEPDELTAMVAGIRVAESALGSPAKQPAPEEWHTREVARRSVVAAVPIAAGETLSLTNLAVKRPGTGVSPMDIWSLLGQPARRSYDVDEMIDE